MLFFLKIITLQTPRIRDGSSSYSNQHLAYPSFTNQFVVYSIIRSFLDYRGKKNIGLVPATTRRSPSQASTTTQEIRLQFEDRQSDIRKATTSQNVNWDTKTSQIVGGKKEKSATYIHLICLRDGVHDNGKGPNDASGVV